MTIAKPEPPKHRTILFNDSCKVNMMYERADVDWYDTLAAHYRISRQQVVLRLNKALRALEAEKPGALAHLLKHYGELA